MKDLLNEEGRDVSAAAIHETMLDNEDHLAPAEVRAEPLFDLVAAGYELMPVDGKKAAFTGWQTAEPMTAEAAAERLAGGGNVGVRLRATDLVIDWDPRDPKAEPDGLARFLAEFGLAAHPHVRTGGGGVHVYLTVPEGRELVGNKRVRPGIDVKKVGGLVVAPGSVHPETGRAYVFHPDPLDDRIAQEAPAALLLALERPAVAEATGGGEMEPEQLAAILEHVPVGDFPDNDTWLTFMMACHHMTGGLARQEFIDWSVSGAGFEDHALIVGRRWDSLHADNAGARVTAGTFWQLVKDYDLSGIPVGGAAEDFEGEEVEPVEGALAERPERTPAWVAAYNARFCVAPMGKEAYVFRDTVADDRARVWEPLSRYGFQELYRHDQVEVGTPEKPKRVPLATLWLNHPRRRFAERVVFDPSRRRIDGALNTWRGWSCKPERGDWSLMERVIREALAGGDEEHAAYILNWLAFGFQHPAELPRVALVFRGGKGVGKGSLGQTVHKIAGHHGLSVSGMSQVSGKFNAHLRQRVFVFADEVFASGDKEAESVLKRLITEPMLTFEAKGVDARNGDNYCKLILASNEEWVVPVSGDERRFAVFDVAPVFQGDRAFWDAVHEQLDAGGREAMLYDLLRRDIRGWHPTQVPQTQALVDQKTDSLAGFDRWWAAVLLSGRLPNGADWVEGTLIDAEGKEAFLSAVNAELRGQELNVMQLGRKVSAMGLDTKAHDRKGQRAWLLPSLVEARRAFKAKTGCSLE